MKAYGLILAGGIGRRMGSDTPKQFLKVKGQAIISYTVKTFLENEQLEKVIVLVPEDWLEYTKDVFLRDLGKMPDLDIIEGGELRNDTIMAGIAHVKANYDWDDDTVVVTHDAVRPFVTGEIIDANIEIMKDYVACDTVVPATDTIVESQNHLTLSAIPDRSKLYQGQTPQSFRMNVFERLYSELTEEEKEILTDAAKVFVLKGEKVALVEGATNNIKITYPSDMDLARAILGQEK